MEKYSIIEAMGGDISEFIKPLKKYDYPIVNSIVITQKGEYSIPQYAHCGKANPEERMQPIKNELDFPRFLTDHTKDGLWTAPYNELTGCDYLTRRVVELRYNEYLPLDTDKKLAKVWLLYPKKNVKVYMIDNRQDFLDLIDKYPLSKSKFRGLSENMAESSATFLLCKDLLSKWANSPSLDYEAVYKDYQGILLTKQGFETNYLTGIFPYPMDMRPDDILWSDWHFEDIKGPMYYDITNFVEAIEGYEDNIIKLFDDTGVAEEYDKMINNIARAIIGDTPIVKKTSKSDIFPELEEIKRKNTEKFFREQAEWKKKYWK